MSKTIYCLAEQAFVHSGDRSLDGGGERWLCDFISVLKSLNYNVKLFQYSHETWNKKFYGHSITGLGNIKNPMRPTDGYMDGLREFLSLAEKGRADGIFFLSLNLCSSSLKIPVISVNHGIIFDRCEKDEFIKPVMFLDAMKQWIRNTTHTISVDTNGIHVQAAYWPDNIKKMSYIPNYFDENKFTPYKKEDNGKFTVLFPRRIDRARGYQDFMAAIDILHPKHQDNLEFILCGKGNADEERELSNWIKGKESYVTWTNSHPDEMYKTYRQADLSVVCTRYAEGSSLAAIEAMATGLPNIVTTVGGLNDLVIPQINGLVIPPKNPEVLAQAIEYCYLNPEHMEEMRENAIRISKAFTKSRWEKEIINVVKQVYGEP